LGGLAGVFWGKEPWWLFFLLLIGSGALALNAGSITQTRIEKSLKEIDKKIRRLSGA
jgi:hypothetical protein